MANCILAEQVMEAMRVVCAENAAQFQNLRFENWQKDDRVFRKKTEINPQNKI